MGEAQGEENPSTEDVGGVEGGPNVGGIDTQAKRSKDSIRAYVTLIFVSSYLLVIAGIPLLLLWLKTIDVEGFKDIVLALGSTLGAPLGIVLNNYFKDEASK